MRSWGRFVEELFDLSAGDFLVAGALPVELAVPPEAEAAAFVDDVDGRPDVVVPGVPHRFLLVDGDGKFEVVLVERGLERGNVFFGGGLGRVDADERDAFAGELALPLAVPGIVVDGS